MAGALLLILSAVPPLTSQPAETAHWFPFNPQEDFSPSLIDLSHWLDAPAGKHGFVEMNNDDFRFADGTPVKFWGVNICSRLPYAENERADRWAKYLAKYGVNAVRFHKFTRPAIKGPTSTQLDSTLLARMDYFHAALRQKGIYYGWSPIYGHQPQPGDSARLLAYQEVAQIKVPWSHLNGATSGLVNFAEDLQDLHIELMLNMLNHYNPFTGLRYADDSALCFIELQNEDNIFWSAIEKSLEQTPTYRTLLCKLFSDWLRRKYRTQTALRKAWGDSAFKAGESLELSNIYPDPNHGLFDWEYQQTQKTGQTLPRHLLDKARFLYETQVKFYERFVKAIRETGYGGPIVASCWQAGGNILHFYNLHADFLSGPIDRHNYFGGGTGHQLTPGKVNSIPMLSQPGSGLLSSGMQVVAGRPFAFSEWMSLLPNEWTAEAAPIIAVYGMCLQGWDASYAFASNIPHLSTTVESPHHGVYNVDSPLQIGLYPVLARMLYRGDVREADVITYRNIHLPALIDGKLGFTETVVQEHDVKSFRGDVPSEILAVGRIPVRFTPKLFPTELPQVEPFWDRAQKIIRSSTGQLLWNYVDKGYFTINTPGTQGMVGFAGGTEIKLQDLTIQLKTPFTVLLVTSLERDRPIATAKNLLLVAVSRAQNKGMQYNADRTQLLEVGTSPLLLEPVQAMLSLKRADTATLHVLDHAGRRSGRKINVTDRSLELAGEVYKTIYYELEFSNQVK